METTQTSLDHLIWENPMGEARKDALRLNFDRKLELEFHGTKVTNDAERVNGKSQLTDVHCLLYVFRVLR